MALPALIPTTTTLSIAATFSPPTTCFPSVPASTYTLLPSGPDSQVEDRLVIRSLVPQCYPSSILSLGNTSYSTITVDGQPSRAALPTAPWFSASACPSGFFSAGGQTAQSTKWVHCCPSGPYTLQPVDVGTYSGCVQTPTAPVTLVNGTSTTTLTSATNEPFGISFRPLEIVFLDNGTTNSTESDSPDSSPSSKSDGLTTGAKAGLGIGVVVLVLLLVGGGILIWWLKRRKSSQASRGAAEEAVEVPGDDHTVHELGRQETVETGVKRNSAQPMELDTKRQQEWVPPVELEGDHGLVHEAPVTEKPGELPSGK